MSERWAKRVLREMEPSLIRRLAAALMMMKDVVVLAGGDPDFPTPSHIVEAAVKALREGMTHYTPTKGIPQLREAIAAYYKKFGVEVDPEREVIVTPEASRRCISPSPPPLSLETRFSSPTQAIWSTSQR